MHVEYARGPSRGRPGGRGGFSSSRYGSRGSYHSGRGERSSGLSYSEKYGPPRNTEYRVIVENLSSRVSWQVSHALSVLSFRDHGKHLAQKAAEDEGLILPESVWLYA